jgi:cytochrome c oxidase subunit 3
MITHRNYLVHPQYIIIALIIAGITALFLGFTGSYLYTRFEHGGSPIRVPQLFYFNSLWIVASSVTLIYAKKMYLADNTYKFKLSLWFTLGLTLIFLVMQIFAWNEMQQMNQSLTSSTMSSYMYLISGLHFLHLVAGIPFLGYFIYEAHKRMKDPVTVLVYFTDPDKSRTLKILNIYWHFLDGLWIYLVIFFLLNYLI